MLKVIWADFKQYKKCKVGIRGWILHRQQDVRVGVEARGRYDCQGRHHT